MKKLLFVFLLGLAALPLNAQKQVKYVTFYPVPYGAHQNSVKVGNSGNGTFIINMISDKPKDPNIEGDSGYHFQTEIAKNFEVASVQTIAEDSNANFKFLDIEGSSAEVNNLYTGSIDEEIGESNASLIYGHYSSQNTLQISSINNLGELEMNNISVSDRIGNITKSKFNGKTVSWTPLRIKGSQNCQYYLVASGGGNTGCEANCMKCVTGKCKGDNGICRSKTSLENETRVSCVGNVALATGGTLYRSETYCDTQTINGQTCDLGWKQNTFNGNCTCRGSYQYRTPRDSGTRYGECYCPYYVFKVVLHNSDLSYCPAGHTKFTSADGGGGFPPKSMADIANNRSYSCSPGTTVGPFCYEYQSGENTRYRTYSYVCQKDC